MSKLESITTMLRLAKRLDEIVADMKCRKEFMLESMNRKAA
ncbi:hypothetical protein [Hafnia paralvei]|nr:hypothetical protein [Hafnia paralvei]EPC06721.1 hypothetical protein HMPREF0864_04729 [Enterobacteriaceae bacterium 9_2_54FAA]